MNTTSLYSQMSTTATSLSSLPNTSSSSSSPHPHSLSFPSKTSSHTFNFKHPPFPSLKSNQHHTLLPTPSSTLTPSSTTAAASTFDLLAAHLAASDFRKADDETRRLLIVLAGDNAVKRGYVFFSEVRFIDQRDLKQIDDLWKEHSGGRFGYSVQKRIWEKKAKRDFTTFFIKVGWMKKLDTEVEQWNYRSFPDEFVWEMKGDAPPEGHLPLTNALRGTQLLTSIFTHPAFEEEGEEVVEEDVGNEGERKERVRLGGGNRNFKTDYSF